MQTQAGSLVTTEAVVHFVLVPEFDFREDLQADSRLDVFVRKNNTSQNVSLAVKESFLDFLFWDSVRVRGGFLKNDLGYNSFFHPLSVFEMSPEFSRLFPSIVIGRSDEGTEALPAASFGWSGRFFDDTWRVSWDTATYFLSATSSQKNFYLSKLDASVDNVSFGLVGGGQGRAIFNKDPDLGYSVGGYGTWVSPWGVSLFWEGLGKTVSYRATAEAGNLVTKRNQEVVFSQSVRGEYSWLEPWFKNTVGLQAEYFHYGEGQTVSHYDSLIRLVEQGQSSPDGRPLFAQNRNLRDYAEAGITYGNQSAGVGANYRVVLELGSWLSTHTGSLSKRIGSATISGFATWKVVDELYLATVGGNRLTAGVQLSLEL